VTARTILSEHGAASGILGRHVFAHVDDVHSFFDGIDACLAPDGVFVIEVPYLGDFLEKLEFDTIYHEHLSYVSLEPMSRLCEMHGFELVDVERGSLHGGVIILHMRRAGVGQPSDRLRQMLLAERHLKLSHPANLQAFARRVTEWKEKFEALIDGLDRSGATFIGYGAAAKANTLLNYCPDVARTLWVILDRSPHKHGRYTPGTHILVEPAERWKTVGASHMVVLAWNFQQEIVRQMKPFGDSGGRFIVPIPTPRVL
jgi:novobiocin biosynthesis protein NovU/D-mycarose 3-C-methyltransferase